MVSGSKQGIFFYTVTRTEEGVQDFKFVEEYLELEDLDYCDTSVNNQGVITVLQNNKTIQVYQYSSMSRVQTFSLPEQGNSEVFYQGVNLSSNGTAFVNKSETSGGKLTNSLIGIDVKTGSRTQEIALLVTNGSQTPIVRSELYNTPLDDGKEVLFTIELADNPTLYTHFYSSESQSLEEYTCVLDNLPIEGSVTSVCQSKEFFMILTNSGTYNFVQIVQK